MLSEFVPQGFKEYAKLISAKLRHRDCFIDSPWIGRDVHLEVGCSISRGAELGNGVRLGEYSYVNSGAIIASGTLGRFCSVGPYSIVGMPEHPTSFLSTSPRLYGPGNLFGEPSGWDDFPNPPVIGSDVWIGGAAFVRQGVRIGHGAVVGAGAVVTRDVAPYAIVAGVPARQIRLRFDPEVVEALLAMAWWEWSLDRLSTLAEFFQTPWSNVAEIAMAGAVR